jgi:cysteinyl-tRNA synthetase
MLKLYNTLSKTIEPISPADGKTIRMYTCGPTVYNNVHIGNMRSFIMADLLYRSLKFDGYQVEYVMNITDIDDKTIASTVAEFGQEANIEDLDTFTTRYLNSFLEDLEAVNIDVRNIKIIRVSDVISQIQDFIVTLLEKGFAYQSEDGVYFSIEKYQAAFGDYGALVGDKFLEGKKIGARVAVDEYEKDNLSDFALWKGYNDNDRNIFWEHPVLGKGRPGWHIECSVINKVGFGDNTIDIHTGGIDLIFPHHTNEIAQSQPLGPFVKHWFHSAHLMVEDDKMAKSKKNFYTLRDIEEKGFSGLDLRYLYLQSNYRTQQNFTWESLQASKTALQKLKGLVTTGNDDADAAKEFAASVNNDLNTSQALATIWEQRKNFAKYDEVLGLKLSEQVTLKIPDEVQALIKEREAARHNKEFAKSDELRDAIATLGFEVKDTSEGQQVNKI